MAEVIQGVFPGGEGPDGTLPGVSAVAALNLSPKPGDPEGNLLLAEREIAAALALEPSLRYVVLPELFTSSYSALESVYLYAEDAEYGESARFFTGLARELGIYIAYGFPEGVAGSHAGVFDSANLVGPEGVVATYRKRNLVGTTPEHVVFTPGTESQIVEAGGMRVSLAICWDMGFPEMAREAALGGADLILVPAAWREPWGLQYDLSCAARALDNGVYVASANQAGTYPEASFATPGHAYGPDGTRVSLFSGTASIGTVDPTTSLRWRARYGNTLLRSGIGEEPMEIVS
jgi:predicted amidohydrolase